MKKTVTFFDEQMAQKYDQNAERLSAINDNLYLLMEFVLAKLPKDANILCVGVGTGSEVISLAKTFHNWRFTGIDPSYPMVEVCRNKIENAGLSDRCVVRQGYIDEISDDEQYDAVLCLLVMHFITDMQERKSMYEAMHRLLKKQGYLIATEICGDTKGVEFESLFTKWLTLQKKYGATEETLQNLKQNMTDHLGVISSQDTETLMKNSGFKLPVQFFQSLLIRGWYARKVA